MRWFSPLLGSLALIALPLHAVELTGIVLDSSGTPISGATVKVVGLGSDTTTQTGEFRIPSNVRIGQRVNVTILKDGWTQQQPLTYIVPADPVADPFRITLSKALSFGRSDALNQPTVDFSVISETPDSEFTVAYSADRLPERLRITPALPYLDLFRRGGPITPRSYWNLPFQMTLPQLDIKVTNNTNKTVFFNEAVFIVDSSQLDPSPLLLIPGTGYNMRMDFENFGWKRIADATIRCNLIRPGEPKDFTQPATEIIDVTEDDQGDISVDFSEVLARLGVDVETLSHPFDEYNGKTYKVTEKTGRIVLLSDAQYKKRILKACGPFPEGAVEVVGEISYANPVDTSKMESVRFLGSLEFGEAPAGAPAPPSFGYGVKLDVDGQRYERRVQLAQALKPQDFDRFTIRIAADKSSIHRFRLRLLYDNGLDIESPPIELSLFMPRGAESLLRNERQR